MTSVADGAASGPDRDEASNQIQAARRARRR